MGCPVPASCRCSSFLLVQSSLCLGRPRYRPGRCFLQDEVRCRCRSFLAGHFPLRLLSLPSASLGFFLCCWISSASFSSLVRSSAQFPIFARASLSRTSLRASCLICAVSAITSACVLGAFCGSFFLSGAGCSKRGEKSVRSSCASCTMCHEEFLSVMHDVSFLSPFGFPPVCILVRGSLN